MAEGDNQYRKFKGFKWTVGNEDVPALALVVDQTSRQLHITEPSDVGTDWDVAACSHPTVYIHSATDPATDFLKMYHDGTDAYIDAGTATALNFGIGGTNYMEMTTSGLTPTIANTPTLGSAALPWGDLFLGTGAVINFYNSEITMTHSSIGTGGKVLFETTWSTASAVGRPLGVSLTLGNVLLGGYVNAFKAFIDCGTAGRTAGVLSASNHEIDLPSTGGGSGVYTCVEHEMVAPDGFNSSGCMLSFMYFNAAGTDVADIYAVADFFHIDSGVVAGSGSTLSANSQTLRVGLGANAGTKRYLVMSQMENGLGLGVTGTHMSLTSAATKAIRIYTTTAVSTATQMSAVEVNYARTAGQAGDGRDWGIKCNMTSTHQQPTFTGIYASCTVDELGTLGRGSAIQGELIFPAGSITRGTFSAVNAEISYEATTAQAGGPCSFFSGVVNGGVAADDGFDDAGNLFELSGLTAGTSGTHLFETSASVDANEITAALRVRIDGVPYYLLMCTPTDIQD